MSRSSFQAAPSTQEANAPAPSRPDASPAADASAGTRTGTGTGTGINANATAASSRYHHGDLRDALLDAAGSILLEGGVQAFTLRECARRAGVSHAAPAHHFGDARGLLTAFATRGFERMAALMRQYRDAAGPEPTYQLLAVGRGYIDFALQHRAHFQLMFGRDRLDPCSTELQTSGLGTHDMLRDTMAATLTAAGISPAELPHRMLLAWSAVHGYATLLLDGHFSFGYGLDMNAPDTASAAGATMLALLQPALVARQGA